MRDSLALSLAAALSGAFLGACAGIPGAGLKPGVATEGEVRAALGRAGHEWQEADGTRGIAFPKGPLGTETFVARIDANGRLAAYEQVLDEGHFRRIRPGQTTQDEVLRLIGPPWRRIDFANKAQVAWDYRFRDAWGYLAEFSVVVDAKGVVAETVTVREESRRNDR